MIFIFGIALLPGHELAFRWHTIFDTVCICNSYNMGTRDCMVYIALKPEGVSPEG